MSTLGVVFTVCMTVFALIVCVFLYTVYRALTWHLR